MCGLAGIVNGGGAAASKQQVERSFNALANRGPDAQHIWQEGSCTLLHARLRILDVSERADQPMSSASPRRLVMIYNGEIYNYRTLRSDLSSEGWQFKTTSDAEVLLQGFQAWGLDVFRRARGMWAVAFWEPDAKRLTLARDPLGKKPLVYFAEHNRIVFASNAGALLGLLDRTPAIDLDALDCYLGHLCIPQEHSIFQGVRKVQPGTALIWEANGRTESRRYWNPPHQPDLTLGYADAVDETERLLRESVRRRLESDVPLGVFLSAGYDSGVVAALAAQESGRALVAVTAGTTGSGYDERGPAALIAERYGLSHRPLEVDPLSAAPLPELIAELGEPFGDSSLLPSYQVARAARREITVALTGDGGDEGFFGYETFRGVWLAEKYRHVVPKPVRDWLWKWNHSRTANGWRRGAEAILEYGRLDLALSFRNRMGFSEEQRRRLLPRTGNGHAHFAEHIYAQRLRSHAQLPDADALRRTLLETYLPNDYLAKVDTATMAASLEARCPFLDTDLIEFLLRLPESTLFAGGRLKDMLRPLARRLLPQELVNRRKTGFGVPVASWLRTSLTGAFETFVLRPGTSMSELINQDASRQYFLEHARGADHSTRLWGLLALGVWASVILDRTWKPSDPLPVALAAVES